MDVTVIDAEAGLASRVPVDDPDAADARAIDGGELIGCWRLPATDQPMRALDVRFGVTVELDLDLVGVWFRHPTGPALLPLSVLRQRVTDGRLGRIVRIHVPPEVDLLALLRFATADDLQRAWDRLPGAFGMGGGAEEEPPRMEAEAPEAEAPEAEAPAMAEPPEEEAEEAPAAPLPPRPPVVRGPAGPPPEARPTPERRAGRPRGPIFGVDEGEGAEAVGEPPAAEAAPGAPAAERTVLAHLHAEMPEQVVVLQPFPVRFGLARRAISTTPGFTGDAQTARIDPKRDVTVKIVPRGFRMADDAPRTVTLRLPTGDRIAWHEFTLVAPTAGVGEVALIVRQGADLPLATLRLTAVASESVDGPAAPRGATAAVTRPDPQLLALPTIRIDEELVDGASTLDIRATVAGESASGEVRFDDKRAFVTNLYRRIDGIRASLTRIRDTRRRGDEAVRALGRLGRALAVDLLPPDVLDLLWRHRDELDGLIVQTTGEVDIPWEVVHLVPPPSEEGDDEPRFLSRTGMTRWVYGTAHPTEIHVSSERTRVVCPEYRVERFRLTATAEERTLLEERLHASLVTPEDATGIRDLVRGGFDLLHFAGHGHWTEADPPAQEILLADFDDEAPPPESRYSDGDLRMDLPDLGMVDEDADGPFVFLNACDLGRLASGERSLGGFPEAFLRGGVSAFIGCSWSVGDDPAGSFVRAFYAALVDGRSLAEATVVARTAAAESADLSDLAFAVYAHPRARLLVT